MVETRQRPLPPEMLHGDYQNDHGFRARFQQSMNTLWQEKDADLAALLGTGGHASTAQAAGGAASTPM